jgi:hypothetical protein
VSENRDDESPAIESVKCPSCGSFIDATERRADLVCVVCNMHFVLAGHLCPACGAYHEDDQATCLTCGTPMVRLCWHCQATNWTGDEICIQCGESIDLLSQLEAKSSRTTPDRLNEQMAASIELNETEADASKRRMAELMAIEEARQAELRRQNARRKRQERNMLLVVFVAVVIFLLAMLGYALFSALA